MNSLLKLKHWQLFLLSWGPALLLNFFAASDPLLMMKLFPVAMLLFSVGTFGWIWAISAGLHQQLPPTVDLDSERFKILFAIPIIYILAIVAGVSFFFYSGRDEGFRGLEEFIGIIILLHFLSIFCIFYGIRFAAKTIKSIELGRPVSFGDYAGEFFLIWFSIIGYWIIQPRLNRLAGGESTQPKTL